MDGLLHFYRRGKPLLCERPGPLSGGVRRMPGRPASGAATGGSPSAICTHFLRVRLERGESSQAGQGFRGLVAEPRVDSPPPLNYHGKLARPGPARRNPLNPARTER